MRAAGWVAVAVLSGAAAYALSRSDVQQTIGGAVGEAVDKIKELIAGAEGVRLVAYQDVAGKWTIGYGHLITPADGLFPYGDRREITEAEALELFDADTATARACVDRLVGVPLTENQYAALVSFVFNVGCGAFQGSTLLRVLNDGDYVAAADQLDRWVNAGGVKVAGLVNRRQLEKEVFLA